MCDRWRGGYQTASPSWFALAIDRIFGMYSGVQPGIVSSLTLMSGCLSFQPSMFWSRPIWIQSETSLFLTMWARTSVALPLGAAAAGCAAAVVGAAAAAGAVVGAAAAAAGAVVGAAAGALPVGAAA